MTKMLKKFYFQLKTKFDALNPREQGLLIIAVLVVVGVFFYNAVVLPLSAYRRQLETGIAVERGRISKLHERLGKQKAAKITYYQGKDSELIQSLNAEIEKHQLTSLSAKQSGDHTLFLWDFKMAGELQNILNFITAIESYPYFIEFHRCDISFRKGGPYRFSGLIKVAKL